MCNGTWEREPLWTPHGWPNAVNLERVQMCFVLFQNKSWPWNSMPRVSVKFFPLKTLFFLCFFLEELDLRQGGLLIKNTINFIIYLKLDFHPLNWVTTWNETPLCRWSTGWLHNPACQLLFFLMKQPRLWFYGHSWVWERHRSASLRWNRLLRVLRCASLSFTPFVEFFLHSSAEEELIGVEINLKCSVWLYPLHWWLLPSWVSGFSHAVWDVCLFSWAESQTCYGCIPKDTYGFVLEPIMGCVWKLGPKTRSPGLMFTEVIGEPDRWGWVLLCEPTSQFLLAKAGTWLRFLQRDGTYFYQGGEGKVCVWMEEGWKCRVWTKELRWGWRTLDPSDVPLSDLDLSRTLKRRRNMKWIDSSMLSHTKRSLSDFYLHQLSFLSMAH